MHLGRAALLLLLVSCKPASHFENEPAAGSGDEAPPPSDDAGTTAPNQIAGAGAHAGTSAGAGGHAGASGHAGAAGTSGSAGNLLLQAGRLSAAGSGGAASPPDGSPLLLGVSDWGLRARSTDGASWLYCANKSTGNDHSADLLRNVAYGAGVFIAVGGDANGMVMRSLDGEHWQEDIHPTTACKDETYPSSCSNWMGAIAYADGVWLAGGGNGASMRSLDAGLTWTGLHHGFPEKHIRSLHAGSGRFIAGTDGGALYVTQDAGDSWSMKYQWSGAPSNAVLFVEHAQDTFVAFTRAQSPSERACFVSMDGGEHWEACNALVKTTSSVVYDGTRWVASVKSGYATSSDAKAWTMHTASNVPSDLLYDAASATWFGRSAGNVYRGASLDAFQQVAMSVPDYRAWVLGRVLAANLPVTGSVCTDNR
jgi:hypothetical protein